MPLVDLSAVIEGDDLDPQRLKRGITVTLRQEANEIDALYRAFYSTWKGSDRSDPNKEGGAIPNMMKRVSLTGRDAYAEVSTRGRTTEFGNRKLLWLDDGTKERWAVMSANWRSKTRRGSIRSGGGGGRVVKRGKRNMKKPMRGVRARNVSEAIAKEREPEFQSNVDVVIDEATR